MSCPDWSGLLAHRFEARGRAPRAWPAAMEHLGGCRRCRERVAVLDPTVLLAGLPEPPGEPGEVEAMRRAVAEIRRARDVEREIARASGGTRRWAAAAAVAAGLLLPGHLALEPAVEAPPETLLMAPAAGSLFRPAPELGGQPLLEPLDRPEARVYQLSEEGLSLAIVVDESLDV